MIKPTGAENVGKFHQLLIFTFLVKVLMAQLSHQQESVTVACDKITQVKEQVRDLQR